MASAESLVHRLPVAERNVVVAFEGTAYNNAADFLLARNAAGQRCSFASVWHMLSQTGESELVDSRISDAQLRAFGNNDAPAASVAFSRVYANEEIAPERRKYYSEDVAVQLAEQFARLHLIVHLVTLWLSEALGSEWYDDLRSGFRPFFEPGPGPVSLRPLARIVRSYTLRQLLAPTCAWSRTALTFRVARSTGAFCMSQRTVTTGTLRYAAGINWAVQTTTEWEEDFLLRMGTVVDTDKWQFRPLAQQAFLGPLAPILAPPSRGYPAYTL